jgi:hypothetical protein
MSDDRPSFSAATTQPDNDDPHAWLRDLGARAHQLRAATRAADHFNGQDAPEDRNTGSWLMSSASVLALELAADIDSLARSLKDRPVDAGLHQRMAGLRVRAHQLHATTRAADHFLDLDTPDGRDTGSWLIASAQALAQKLAGEIDDSTLSSARRPASDRQVADIQDAAAPRRVGTAAAAIRGAA